MDVRRLRRDVGGRGGGAGARAASAWAGRLLRRRFCVGWREMLRSVYVWVDAFVALMAVCVIYYAVFALKAE